MQTKNNLTRHSTTSLSEKKNAAVLRSSSVTSNKAKGGKTNIDEDGVETVMYDDGKREKRYPNGKRRLWFRNGK